MITLDHCVYLILMARLEKERARHRAMYAANREKEQARSRAKTKRYRKENPDRCAEANRKWKENNPDKRAEIARKANQKWRKANPDKRRIAQQSRRQERKLKDPLFRIAVTLRLRLRKALSGSLKAHKTLELLGCPVSQLREHLEKQFQPGMTWENYGYRGWHIDHIRPCASFDLTQPDQQRQCFHYSNLQPLWAADNIRKGDKWPTS